MRDSRLRRQDGFVREALWLVLGVVIVAILVLDALALFNAHQSVKTDAGTAATQAQIQYAQTLDLAGAKLAAKEYLAKVNEDLVAFSSTTNLDGSTVFTVTAKAHADTRAFKLLRYVGLKKWVNQMTNPTGTGTAQ
jgi:hypothetical protein